jgi:ABC-type phosphate transport system ATPase subunit
MSSTLDKIIEEVRSLPPEEQRQLREQLNAIVSASANDAELEEEVERKLAAEGLIRVPTGGQQPAGEFQRINVGGQPVSEMIVEERR